MACILSAELMLISDFVAVFFDVMTPFKVFVLVWAVAAVVIGLFGKLTVKRTLAITMAVVGVIALICGATYLVWNSFQKTAAYQDVDFGKEHVYGGRDVMVIVPHQDDETNVLGGVIEEFVHYGSTVRIVYVTNGDAGGTAQTRLNEAIAYGAYVGIPEENIIFLGYGDLWDAEVGVHIYNAAPETTVTSYCGAVKTYGLETHPAFCEGNAYTVENYLADMESVILEYRPEIIFCSDYDQHIDHKATSLAFEKVMGRILRQEPEYKPLVFKGYAYSSAWYAEADFYRLNILSTRNVFAEPYFNKPAVYQWEEGVRFPVDGGTLSRSLVTSKAYEALSIHASQNGRYFAASVVNGDRVFWQRRTDSVCGSSEISVSSGQGDYLNNFMLIDNVDLWNQENPYDSVWIPAMEDSDKTVRIAIPHAQDIYSIVLYDHPSETDNVLNALIEFDDGSRVETGALNPQGASTEIVVQKTEVNSFSVTLLETEGANPGLTEIEAFPTAAQGDISIVKLMDSDGEFVYDYCLQKGTEETFSLYTHGIELEDFSAVCDNDKMRVSVLGKDVVVHCPVGEAGVISVYDHEEKLLDSIYVSNPGIVRKVHIQLAQAVEEYAVFQIRNSVVCRGGKLAVKLFERLL